MLGFQPNSHYELSLLDDESGVAPLVATLANAYINIEFFDSDGIPVTGSTAGTLLIEARYNVGKYKTVASLDLSTNYDQLIVGKYTELRCSLTDLTGATSIKINSDQDINI